MAIEFVSRRSRSVFSQRSPISSWGRNSCRLPRRGLRFEPLEDRRLLSINLSTDKPDYLAGETAQIVASGFATGQQVQFQVTHDPNTPGLADGAGHDPWIVVDGDTSPEHAVTINGATLLQEPDLDGLANGSIQTSWYVNPDDSKDAVFILTAESLSPQGTVLDTGSMTFSDSLATVFEGSDANATTQTTHDWDEVFADVMNFFTGRFVNLMAERNPADVVDAVVAVSCDDLGQTAAKIAAAR